MVSFILLISSGLYCYIYVYYVFCLFAEEYMIVLTFNIYINYCHVNKTVEQKEAWLSHILMSLFILQTRLKHKLFEDYINTGDGETYTQNKKKRWSKYNSTWQIPRFTLVQINVDDSFTGESSIGDFPTKIMRYQLLVCRMKSEPRRKIFFHIFALF